MAKFDVCCCLISCDALVLVAGLWWLVGIRQDLGNFGVSGLICSA